MVLQRASAGRRKGVRRQRGAAVLESNGSFVARGDVRIRRSATLDRAMSGAALKTLVAEFDRCWPEVTRTREMLVLAEASGAG